MSDYKKRVFDEDILKLLLEIFNALDQGDDLKVFTQQVLLDALTYSQRVHDVSSVIETMMFIPDFILRQNQKEILDANILVGEKRATSDYLMTIRHMTELRSFTKWSEFFLATKTLASEQGALDEYFTTARHLLLKQAFIDWESFFKLSKQLKEISLVQQGQIFSSIRHALQYFKTSESYKGLFRVLAEAPQYSEAFALGQLDSKKWLVEEAQKVWGKDWGTVFVLAGWIGVLPRMLWDADVRSTKIRSFDIDETANQASEFLNQNEVQKDWLFKSSTCDITQLQYPAAYHVQRKDGSLCELVDAPDVVINTSCEHIKDIASWWQQIPRGTKVILQSNDGFHISEHVACFKSLNDFKSAMNLSQVDYQGEKALPEFNRFMLIGKK